jgi:hypothetical protein
MASLLRRASAAPALVAAVLIGAPTAAHADPTWAPAGSATVHPGVQTFTAGGQCTANFVFTSGDEVYIGQAAHCSSGGEATDTNGCTAPVLPLGTEVTITGAEHPGTIAYNSWHTMQAVGETDPDACAYNDFALIRIDPRDVERVNPSVPHWGGPAGIDRNGVPAGSTVHSYGNSSLRLGLTVLSPKVGISYGTEGNGWTHVVNTVTPGIPGDSGSAFLDGEGRALGVLSTLGVGVPTGVVNNVSDLGKALDYLAQHADGPVADAQLVDGTEAFSPSQLPVDLADPVDDPVRSICGLLGC